MSKTIFFVFTFLFCVSILGDTPGKKSMSDSRVTFNNIQHLGDYVFYWQGEYDSAYIVKSDTTLSIPGSGGKPLDAMFWGMNKKTKENTDTIFFSNYYSPDYLITIDTVTNGNKLIYLKSTLSNSNVGGDHDDIDDVEYAKNSTTKIFLLAAISLIALLLLIWFFIKRKNRVNEV